MNERIPVSRAALEAHWHVDCASSWVRLSDAWLQAQAGAGCDISVELRDDLELCAFIYQPPGTEGSEGLTETCMDCCRRDYRGAVELLDSAGPVDLCAELAKLPGAQAGCTSPQPQ